jgi:hypothetical protein
MINDSKKTSIIIILAAVILFSGFAEARTGSNKDLFSNELKSKTAERDFELLLLGSNDKYTGLGQRVVFYIQNSHGVVLEQTRAANAPTNLIGSFIGYTALSNEKLSGESNGLAYRFFPSLNLYLQLGLREQTVNYDYLDCAKSCASPLYSATWSGKIRSANLIFGYQTRPQNGRIILGAELGINSNLNNTLVDEKNSAAPIYREEAAKIINESQSKFLSNKLDASLLFYLGIQI